LPADSLLPGHVDAPPFVPSLFVEIRKRMGADLFEAIFYIQLKKR